MSEKFKGEMAPSEKEIEFSDVEKDTEALGRSIEKLERSEQPLPEEAKNGYADLLAAEANTEKLDALKRMDEALEGYDPVLEETVAHDARAFVKRMHLELDKTRE